MHLSVSFRGKKKREKMGEFSGGYKGTTAIVEQRGN